MAIESASEDPRYVNIMMFARSQGLSIEMMDACVERLNLPIDDLINLNCRPIVFTYLNVVEDCLWVHLGALAVVLDSMGILDVKTLPFASLLNTAIDHATRIPETDDNLAVVQARIAHLARVVRKDISSSMLDVLHVELIVALAEMRAIQSLTNLVSNLNQEQLFSC